jgi:hypothetical protein
LRPFVRDFYNYQIVWRVCDVVARVLYADPHRSDDIAALAYIEVFA